MENVFMVETKDKDFDFNNIKLEKNSGYNQVLQWMQV